MRTVKFLIALIVLMTVISSTSFSQTKRTNVWYFTNSGVDFNYGSPPENLRAIYNTYQTLCSISDSNGNFLFASDGHTVYNKNLAVMEGGNMMSYGTSGYYQGPVVFPIPGNERFYYMFHYTGNRFFAGGIEKISANLVYTIIDMQANNGLGKVSDSEKVVQIQSDVDFAIYAVHHKNEQDVWVLNQGFENNLIYAYLVTPYGINPPVISSVGGVTTPYNKYIKISPDGKKFVKTVNNSYQPPYILGDQRVQIFNFDNETGILSDSGMIDIDIRDWPVRSGSHVGFEFSPDGSKFFLSEIHKLYQYDLNAGSAQQILDSQFSFYVDTSSVYPDPPYFYVGSLQLGPDGKIYIDSYRLSGHHDQGLSVIHKPNLSGLESDFRQNDYVFTIRDIFTGWSTGAAFPGYIADWLKDPEIKSEKHCSNEPVNFSLKLNASIDSVLWDFNDFWNYPHDSSTALSPKYTFSRPGTYNITAKIHFGKLQKTIPYTIEVKQSPQPDLGPADTLMCSGGTLELDAGSGYVLYQWNGNWMPGVQTYTVDDEGEYSVKVKNEFGCYGYDTIQVNISPEPQIITQPLITPANCQSNNGSISGIVLSGTDPFSYIWKNAAGDILATGPDLTEIGAGSYTITVTDGSGCEHTFLPYSVSDIDGVLIQTVPYTNDHCGSGKGTITIIPESGTPNDFEYSINGGETYSANGGQFKNLAEGSYNIMLKDANGCEKAWQEVIMLINEDGPVINQITVTPELESDGQGSVLLNVTGEGLTFSLNGNPSQTEPFFGDLTEGEYTVFITDEFGCMSDTTIWVPNLSGIYLKAIADTSHKCLHKIADSQISLFNVNGLSTMKSTLNFNGDILECTGYKFKMEGLEAKIYPALSSIVLEWQGPPIITNPDTVKLIQLVFETNQPGYADLSWAEDTASTYFRDISGEPMNSVLIPGSIKIHDPPGLDILNDQPLCIGDDLTLIPAVVGGTDPVSLVWHTPTGIQYGEQLNISHADETSSGIYSLSVSDYFNCADTIEFNVNVIPLPKANFPEINDTIWYNQSYTLEATPGYYTYEWNTGDTTWFINVTEQGRYSVQLKTQEGCQNLESVVLMDAYVPISVPNAFTPNGDGLNDTFKPIVNEELISQFHLAIYNQWGQMIFETTNATKGWDGENALIGTYNWVIDYKNRTGKVFQMRGSVVLIR
ncbi:MAG: gliding motility-associated C-terminal domain-containing protein [Lentimicrobium sp.]|nr:gliding motility-associated C-terminal domain-containing protein [Lentimicrobium sp.]